MPFDLSTIGLHFIVGLEGPSLTPDEASLLERLRPAGIILFAKNIDKREHPGWTSVLARLIADARQAAGRSRFIVSIDHEGGRVHRFAAGPTHFPPARRWRENSFAVAQAMGRELRTLGFNLSYAPVLDIHCEPLNDVIGLRAFADNAEDVSNYALAFAQGLHSQGVLSCGKHFPGHGATLADSHYEMPVLDASLELIRQRELLPFIRYIQSGAPLIMTAHVHYPALDPLRPATLSPAVISSLLRHELGFAGTVISDDLEMAALKTLPPRERAVQVLRAGVDLLLEGYPKGVPAPAQALEMAQGVLDALNSGGLDEHGFLASSARIEALFDYIAALQQDSPDTAYPLTLLACQEHQELLAKLA